MKLKLIASATIATVSLLAHAQAPEPSQAASKPATRAEVKAEARTANKAGEIARGEGDLSKAATVKSKKARAAVKSEAKTANVAGEIPRGDMDSAKTEAAKSTMPRADVKAEAKAATKADAIKKGEKPL